MHSAPLLFRIGGLNGETCENAREIPSNELRRFTDLSERINPFPTNHLAKHQFVSLRSVFFDIGLGEFHHHGALHYLNAALLRE